MNFGVLDYARSVSRGEVLTFVGGAAVGVVVAFLAGFSQEVGRAAARRAMSWFWSPGRVWNVVLVDRRAAKARAAESRETARKVAESDARRAVLEAERVGATFHVQEGRNDAGGTATVLKLAPRDRERSVILQTVFPEGREPAEFSPVHESAGRQAELVQRFQIEWASLVRPEADQRHRNARFANLDDDAAGWVTYKRVG